ncbi:MAG: CBS domain-containing protein [Negativicutes bacterium]|nr:CBS domain-containing protein [Negativicutes bacterium]
MTTITQNREFYFSQLLDKPIYNAAGEKIGRIKDMAVRWEGAYPQVVGIKHVSKARTLIPLDQVKHFSESKLVLAETFAWDQTVPLAENAIYISKWLLDKQIIDLQGTRMVRVNDILLSSIQQESGLLLVLAAVDIGMRGLFRRLGAEFLLKNARQNLLGWQYIKPLENWNSALQISRDKQQLSELHPADIAELLEEMGHQQRVDFMLNLDSQLAGDSLTEVDLETQVDIIEQIDEHHASDILEDMPPDEVADILGELSAEKSEELLNLMEADDAEDVRELMQYEEGTAGALMTTEFLSFAANITASQAIDQLREQAQEAEMIYYLYVIDEAEHLTGVLSLRELILAAPQTALRDIMHTKVAMVGEYDDYDEITEIFKKYSLLAVPVVDEQNVMLGIVTVDDILYVMVPERKMDIYSLFVASKKAGRGRS